jgi:queuine tRNA-ribosyltransferase
MEFDGYAIGGLAVGEPQAVMLEMIETVEPLLADAEAALSDGRRHARRSAGSLSRGIDMFDCVMPTRAGRHGLGSRAAAA